MPLFEKMLSASDAGRIGRLVLPKACAEVSITRNLSFQLLFKGSYNASYYCRYYTH